MRLPRPNYGLEDRTLASLAFFSPLDRDFRHYLFIYLFFVCHWYMSRFIKWLGGREEFQKYNTETSCF